MILDTNVLFIICYSLIAFLGIICFILFALVFHLYNLIYDKL